MESITWFSENRSPFYKPIICWLRWLKAYSIQGCYPPQAEKFLFSTSSWVHVKQLITALLILRAHLRWWSNQSLFQPLILASPLAGVRKVLLILFFSQENDGVGYWGVSTGNLGRERRRQPGQTALCPLRAVSAPSVELPWPRCKHLVLRQFWQLVLGVSSQVSMDISINSSSSLFSRSLLRSSLYTMLFWIYLVSRVSCSKK